MSSNINRREFLGIAAGAAAVTAAAVSGCGDPDKVSGGNLTASVNKEVPTDKMTMRTNPKTKDQVSLLGYGMMRLPTVSNVSARESDDDIDQEQVNKLVDYAIAHGVNMFDTSPAYCKGKSEKAVGIALSRYKRDQYFVSTKLSNFAQNQWSFEESVKMYKNSLAQLQVDYLDYMLLHAIGGSSAVGDCMATLNARYIDNGVLDYLMAEREAGRIRNLGFSFHGDIRAFDYLLSQHDKYHWDFVLIQMNYVDWKWANELNPANTDAEYLYAETWEKRGIPVFIMEPLLGGRLASLPQYPTEMLLQRKPENSIASWSFRWIGSHEGVLSILSGMTYMEHLQDNLRTLSPLDPCTDDDNKFLQRVADEFVKFPLIACTGCQYCMPCPYGIDIPGAFAHYNKCVNEGSIAVSTMDANFAEARRKFLVGYNRKVERERQADHCVGCGICKPHCPQNINIPVKLNDINDYMEKLKQETL